ncbi:DeoD-type purine-nucleoside phosphorylase [Trueperella pyogenes]|uniref:Uridine phosphorylase n=1 Tax=Trueperella pyogenes TaxID=1661 RepID=X4R8L9_9ACTO|nr:DeoD-type purine-nucleoside phosphorylase [Trueperella pyogenes]AHU89114.1 purine nucleoside phosphorylase [Trueperella pyogenes]AWA43048.1 DeoD-type purine-nucleoside phosphorylase [Trueperella pyogenes]AWG04498.1 DeoD-type purine-nucleoside phosphorylase [Trueperella pyogenes]AWG17226.1 DeoD-type purine-nucleoside phosphorylase [Trueperella pyogenes]AZR00559.1 DeoD-type purine-nucleoside phosphorylase [Trueperella pyogenes]
MATPHINAEKGDFAPAVLLPGDPKRAERMAQMLMPDAKVVSDVRGIKAFTGTVDGKPLSIMASGMGQPSLGIYVSELFSEFDVQRVIRVGTCGGLSKDVKVGDVVIANGAHYEGVMNTYLIPETHFSAVASYNLVKAAADAAGDDPDVVVAPVISRDRFYNVPAQVNEAAAQVGTAGAEMEAGALYGLAARYGKQALAVLTVSDHMTVPGRDMTPEERETKFVKALNLAVAAALS